MPTLQPLHLTLEPDLAQLVREKVASGEYASEQEVIRDSLEALSIDNASIETWLRDEVVPTMEAHDADPSRVLTAEEFRQGLYVHIDTLVAKSRTKA